MGYQTLAFSGKEKTKSENIGDGQVATQHLSPGLFQEVQKITTHKHNGTDSSPVRPEDLATPTRPTRLYINQETNSTSTAYINQIMQRGFDRVQLAGSTASVSKAITLPQAFSDTTYDVIVTLRGYKATAPASRTDITGNADNVIAVQAVTNSTSQFTVYIKPTVADNVFIGFSWIAIGTA